MKKILKLLTTRALTMVFLLGFNAVAFAQQLSIDIADGPFTMEIGDELKFLAFEINDLEIDLRLCRKRL